VDNIESGSTGRSKHSALLWAEHPAMVSVGVDGQVSPRRSMAAPPSVSVGPSSPVWKGPGESSTKQLTCRLCLPTTPMGAADSTLQRVDVAISAHVVQMWAISSKSKLPQIPNIPETFER